MLSVCDTVYHSYWPKLGSPSPPVMSNTFISSLKLVSSSKTAQAQNPEDLQDILLCTKKKARSAEH
jgi:hypothetical protein